MMKVLVVSNSIGGITNTRKEVIQALDKAGADIYLCAPESPAEVHIPACCKYVQNNITRFGTNPIKEIGVIKNIKSIVKRIKPDIILTFTIKPNLYTAIAVGKKVPVIGNITGLSAFLFKDGFVPKMVTRVHNDVLRRDACLFCQNKDTYGQMERLGFKNIRLIPGSGVNVDEITEKPFPAFCDKIECSFVARVQKDKGFFEFIEASKKLPNYRFTVIGPSEDESIINAMGECENISYLGRLPHDKTLEQIAKSHVLILPSYHEGLANVLLEAQALGRPVLTTAVPGCEDAMRADFSGFTFEAKSASAIEAACFRFASLGPEKWKEMGEVGRAFVVKNFDRKIVVDAYMSVIKEVVER